MASISHGALATIAHTMSSRDIAELTGKDHKNVIADIRVMLTSLGLRSADFSADLFDSYGRAQPAFKLPKRETLILVSGYSIPMRAKIVDRWQELESQAQSAPALPNFDDPVSAARAWADAREEVKKQAALVASKQGAINALMPAVVFMDKYVEAYGTKSLREVAKVLGIKEREFTARLEREDVMFRQSGRLLPYARWQNHEPPYFEVKTGETNGFAFIQTRFTTEGVAWIAHRFGGQVQ